RSALRVAHRLVMIASIVVVAAIVEPSVGWTNGLTSAGGSPPLVASGTESSSWGLFCSGISSSALEFLSDRKSAGTAKLGVRIAHHESKQAGCRKEIWSDYRG